MKHIKALDGYRAFAVLIVIFDHWALVFDHGRFVPDFLGKIPWGITGVTMFFVLSGYLISGILMRSKESITQKKLTTSRAFKIFYIRRTLRIFPVYYLLLILLAICCPFYYSFDPKSYYWFFGYATNFYLYVRQDWIGYFMPLWSLGVEEQFYLFWPLLILLLPKKKLLPTIILFGIIGLFSRVYFELIAPPEIYRRGFYYFVTPTCFDSFALGALLAYYQIKNTHYEVFKNVVRVACVVSLIAFCVLIVFYHYPTPQQNIFYRLVISIISLDLIVILSSPNLLSSIAENKVLVYIGKISYGLYLFHNFIPETYQRISTYFAEAGIKIPFTKYALLPYVGGFKQMFLYFAVLMIIASLSWFLFEKPINDQKEKFNY